MSKQALSVFALTMITIGSVDTIRNLPSMALFGTQVIFFFVIAAVFFLIPAALISAELSTVFHSDGGVYTWVREAFGRHWGLLAIWFQWVENIIWYPTILSFIAGTLGYVISPDLGTNRYFIIAVILVAFWATTIVNLLGIKSSARFASVCTILGLVIPMILIIVLGLMWVFNGHPTQIHLSARGLLPDFSNTNIWISLTGIMMSMCGIEIATVHTRDVKNPQKAFPRAMFYSVLSIVLTYVLGALAIAFVVPVDTLSLVSGLMQAFYVFFASYHLAWFLPVIAFCLIVGGLGGVNSWVIAPTRGLLFAAEDDHLPLFAARVNRKEAPHVLLLFQAIIVTIIAFLFLYMPSVNGSYWLLTALASQLYMLMYILMFAAAIALRYRRHAEKTRSFRIPFGNFGMWCCGVAGIIASVVTIIIGFMPPSDINVGGALHYDFLIAMGLVIMSCPPFIIGFFKRKLK